MSIEKLIHLIIIFVLFSGFSENSNPLTFAQKCPEIFAEILPPVNLKADPTTELCSPGFALSFNHQTKTPSWVIERLRAETLFGPASRKYSNFKSDPRLAKDRQAQLADYRGSGYDRGHMAPAGDLKSSQIAMDESFYLSNIAPQVGVGFNRGIWRQLEEKVRHWVRNHGELYVITGPVYYDYTPVIGEGQVVVPDAFFKIIYDPRTFEALTFLLPNQAFSKTSLKRFQTTIDNIEAKTGVDFFNNLSPALEATLELSSPPPWP